MRLSSEHLGCPSVTSALTFTRYLLPTQWYINLNKVVMSCVFFIPLTVIAFFESQLSQSRSRRLHAYFSGPSPEDEGDLNIEDPTCDDEDGKISRVRFDDLVKVFPEYALAFKRFAKRLICDRSTAMTESAAIFREIKELRKRMEAMEKLLKREDAEVKHELIDAK